ncbi:MAG: hypothetical protein L0Y66_23095 [Myxococcaceae bacterium]|nr:hypothetical protein [Myxococcaceae bacterium]MCI0673916.1 hypothetical protein [Myxococcaceae bacterium]
MLIVSLLLVARSVQAEDAWWGRDKALHFGVSMLAPPGGYAAGAALFDRGEQGLLVGMAVGLGIGVAKEVYDIPGPGAASWRDLGWDVLGVATGTALTWAVDRLFFAPVRRQRASRPPLAERSDDQRMRAYQRALEQQLRSAFLELRKSQVPPR